MNVTCPNCGQKNDIDDSRAGKITRCPSCRRLLIAKSSTARPQHPPSQKHHTSKGKRSEMVKSFGVTVKSRATEPFAPAQKALQNLRKCAPHEYELQNIIGSGGMGVVYLARQTAIDREVALKTLNSESPSNDATHSLLVAEAMATGGLEHPNIVPIYDTGKNKDGLPFYVMKHVVGTRWSEVIDKKSLSGNLEILKNVANATAFAHSKGVVHRDLKPANVMLGEFGEVVIMDWGESVALRDDAKASRLSNHNAICGTPAYMPPEIATRNVSQIGVCTDVYLLGAILYEVVTGNQPHTGIDVKDCIRQAAANIIQPAPTKSEILSIAMKAMSTAPADRYQSVQEFQEAIREYEKHTESISMTDRGTRMLEQALVSHDYGVFSRAIVNYEDALELWPGNLRAREGIASAREAYAESALAKGDLDLSWSLIETAGLRNSSLAERVQASQHGHWEPVYYQDFSQQERDFSGLSFCDSMAINVENAMPEQQSSAFLSLPRFCAFWLRDLRIREDVTVEVQLRWAEQVDGLEMLVNSRPERTHTQPSFMPPGYGCQFGGWAGTLNCISKNEVLQAPNTADSVAARFTPGQVYRLTFQRHGEELSLWVNGECVHRRTEPLPLIGEGLDRVCIRNWSAETEILSLAVWRRAMPEKTSPLVAGDSLFRNGCFPQAVNEYLAIAGDFAGKPIAEHALVKAYLAASRLPEDVEDVRRKIKTAMIENFHDSPRLATLWEADCVSAWQRKHWREALDLLPEIFTHIPETRVVIHMLSCPHEPLPEQEGRDLLAWVAKTRKIDRLAINNLGLTDLSPLAGMRLTMLNCGWNRITSLQPLRNMPLTFLDCGTNHVIDLEPLKGMRLSYLECSCNQIKSLQPLTGMPLETLGCGENEITSLDPLAGMPLNRLYCQANALTSLEPLLGMPLTALYCHYNKIISLEPLRGMKLVHLAIGMNEISSLDPLNGVPLTLLHCDFNSLTSLAPLAGSPLKHLVCSANQIADLSPLGQMSSLRLLDIGSNCVASLEPLRGLRLEDLDLCDNKVTSLEPVSGIQPQRLWCAGNPLSELGTFLVNPPPDFVFDSPSLDADFESTILAAWRENPEFGTILRTNLALRALRKRNREVLLAMSTAFQGHHYLAVNKEVSWKEAKAMAESVGGHLITITSREEDNFAAAFFGHSPMCWIGLQPESSGDAWVTGEPLVYQNYAVPSLRNRPFPKCISRFGPMWRCYCVDRIRAAFIIEWDE